MELEDKKISLLQLTSKIVSSHISNNSVEAEQLPELIRQVYQTLSSIEKNGHDAEKLQPVVPVKRSVFPDYIICLEDGKKLKMLKRHIQSAYGLTPEQYRERWNLPPDYPMVAPNYAERRSSLAREIGLGRKNTISDIRSVRRGRREAS
ncbi:MucR family transcriptional regulator [Commensalibacter melissae]|uniref:MucR family transcriptional regulator n=1 Tax=Commensalibacter melissae TaxID=2070537 RepID=UPI000EFD48EB|nr:MucR family transcriptional regulator [Commensalibacter melissae]AYN87303.1 MucR family transcriptional regulator [Commensalibacter melissae]